MPSIKELFIKGFAGANWKELSIKVLALINLVEGVIHLVSGGIGLWGCVDEGIWDWRILTPVVVNVITGLLSLVTGVVLGRGFHHHHIKGLGEANLVEGVIHLVLAGIGLWGCVDEGVWDWRILAPVIENVITGLLSLVTGVVLGRGFHHHHMPRKKKQETQEPQQPQ